MSDTYTTIRCTTKVNERIFAGDDLGENETPFKYVIKDLEGKLLCHIIFKDKDIDGITNEDLLSIIIDRLSCQQEGIKKSRASGFALARCEESKMWLEAK